MTHDTPHDTSDLRWCDRCRLAVEPAVDDSGQHCPACGDSF